MQMYNVYYILYITLYNVYYTYYLFNAQGEKTQRPHSIIHCHLMFISIALLLWRTLPWKWSKISGVIFSMSHILFFILKLSHHKEKVTKQKTNQGFWLLKTNYQNITPLTDQYDVMYHPVVGTKPAPSSHYEGTTRQPHLSSFDDDCCQWSWWWF